MSNFFITIKIKDYIPKIDCIPYNNYTCIIYCNNKYSKIKLINKDIEFFQNKINITNNNDLHIKIKLIDDINNNILIGEYNFVIPSQKLLQMMNGNSSLIQRQIKLIMNPTIKKYLFNLPKILPNIYLDLLIEIALNHKKFNNTNLCTSSRGIDYNKYVKKYQKKTNYSKSPNRCDPELVTILYNNNKKIIQMSIKHKNNKTKPKTNNYIYSKKKHLHSAKNIFTLSNDICEKYHSPRNVNKKIIIDTINNNNINNITNINGKSPIINDKVIKSPIYKRINYILI